MPQKLKYLGVPVFMNGQNYYIPSLPYQAFKANYSLLTTAPGEESEKLFEYFDALLPVIGQAVRRNYPEVTDELLADWLDMTTLPLAIKAVQSASGITPVSEGE
jgi:hypothetical protein